MSTLGDAVAALKNVVLMQERLDVVRRELEDISSSVERLGDDVVALDRRMVRIETMIEMTTGRGASPPRLEG
jgi:hypothetical protein